MLCFFKKYHEKKEQKQRTEARLHRYSLAAHVSWRGRPHPHLVVSLIINECSTSVEWKSQQKLLPTSIPANWCARGRIRHLEMHFSALCLANYRLLRCCPAWLPFTEWVSEWVSIAGTRPAMPTKQDPAQAMVIKRPQRVGQYVLPIGDETTKPGY